MLLEEGRQPLRVEQLVFELLGASLPDHVLGDGASHVLGAVPQPLHRGTRQPRVSPQARAAAAPAARAAALAVRIRARVRTDVRLRRPCSRRGACLPSCVGGVGVGVSSPPRGGGLQHCRQLSGKGGVGGGQQRHCGPRLAGAPGTAHAVNVPSAGSGE
jgi:hypothetical protein